MGDIFYIESVSLIRKRAEICFSESLAKQPTEFHKTQ